MSNEKKKVEKKEIIDSLREKTNKNLNLPLIIFMFFLILLFITLQITMNNLGTQIEKSVENLILENEKAVAINQKIVTMVEDLTNETKKYNQTKIGRDQFTEIYMQLQELTGMISNEAKREYYITKAVNDISKNNTTLDSKSIYEISKTIYEESIKYNFNPLLVTSIIKIESNYEPTAVSDSYAYGLCQVRRFIAPELAENINIKWDGAEKTLFDPIKNIKIGVYYLSILNRDFNNLKTAVIAYNQGPYAVQERLTNNQELPDHYLNKVLEYYATLRGFSWEEVQNEIKATE